MTVSLMSSTFPSCGMPRMMSSSFTATCLCEVVNFTRHLKRCWDKLTGMTGGVMSRGKKSYGERPHFVATRERSQQSPRTTRTYASCPVCSMHNTTTTVLEDSCVGEEMWSVSKRYKHWLPWRSIELRYATSFDWSKGSIIDAIIHRTTSRRHVTRKT